MKKNLLQIIIISLLPFIVHAQVNIDSGLVAYYPFDGNAQDESINTNNGIVQGALLTDDRFGNLESAYHFDGINDIIDVGNSNTIRPYLPISISAWVKMDEKNRAFPIFRNNYTYHNYFGVGLHIGADGFVRIFYGDGGSIGASNRRSAKAYTTSIKAGNWYHIVGIIRGPRDMELYVNGIKETLSYSGSGGSLKYNSDHAHVAHHNSNYNTPSNYAKGKIDDIRFYDRVLTTDEVQDLFNEPNIKELLKLTAPNGNEYLVTDSTFNIEWKSNKIEYINISYSSDNGNTWSEIVSNYPAIDEQYPWDPPALESNQCLVQLTSTTNIGHSDTSDNSFTITQDVLKSGLIAYYPFNSSAQDESYNDNDGIVEGAVLSEDRFGNPESAYHFDGLDDFIDCGSDKTLKPELPVSISAWINCDIENKTFPIFRNNYSYTNYYGIAFQVRSNNFLSIFFGDGGEIGPDNRRAGRAKSTKIKSGKWYHVVGIIRAKDDMELYVDGVQEELEYDGTGDKIRYNSNNGNIARHNFNQFTPANYAQGFIDDIRFYNRVLNEHEVLSLFNEKNTKKSIEVISPNGGERWTIGSQHYITWKSNGVAQIKIEYSANNGSNWNKMPVSIPAESGSYLWTVPNDPSDHYLIKISDYSDESVADTSDGVFKVLPVITTIITHGFDLDIGTPEWSDYKWEFSMADKTSDDRQILFFRKGEIYQTGLITFSFSLIDDNTKIDDLISSPNNYFSKTLDIDRTKNVAIVFDWVEESDFNSFGWSEGAGDALAASLLRLSEQYPWILEKLHFIGHSRGTVVNSEAIQRLIYFGAKGYLPNNINLDKNIHMTTLDPHPAGHWLWTPQRDDDVNSSLVQVWDTEEKKNIHTGVTGWIMAPYKVGYIDNYFHPLGSLPPELGPVHFRGMNNIPGSGLNLDLKASNRFDNDDEFQGTHSRVHAWYMGTVSPTAQFDEFDDAKSIKIKRDSWYADQKGEHEGFALSFNRSNDSILQIVSNNSLNLVTNDNTFGDDFLVFNGDFSKGSADRIPGWDYQGGSGPAKIDAVIYDGIVFGNTHLVLKDGQDFKTHNNLYVPRYIDSLSFRMKIKYASVNTKNWLIVKFGNEPVGYFEIKQNKEYEWEKIGIKKFAGTTQTITFKVSSTSEGFLPIVWIDDIGFLQKKYFNINLTFAGSSSKKQTLSSSGTESSMYLHAYDNQGNHTGPLTDSTWTEEIPGSHFRFLTDSVSGIKSNEIVLPGLKNNLTYQLVAESKGCTGISRVSLEDVTGSHKTISLLFDSVQVSENTFFYSSFRNIKPDQVLEIDRNGDGAIDNSLYSKLFFENFRIIQKKSYGLSATTKDTTIVNYGDSITYVFTADSGYIIKNVYVDNDTLGAISKYTFKNINDDHSLFVEYDVSATLKDLKTQPLKYILGQNYPNPFNPSTAIRYQLKKAAPVSLIVYDILGREVARLVEGRQNAGKHQVRFNANSLASGVYVYRLMTGDFVQSRKMLLLR